MEDLKTFWDGIPDYNPYNSNKGIEQIADKIAGLLLMSNVGFGVIALGIGAMFALPKWRERGISLDINIARLKSGWDVLKIIIEEVILPARPELRDNAAFTKTISRIDNLLSLPQIIRMFSGKGVNRRAGLD